MSHPDYYAVLGVSPAADDSAIQRAFRRLCRRYHPDVCTDLDAGQRMREINAAYAVLRDPARRRAYDRARIAGSDHADAWVAARRAWRPSARPPDAPRPRAPTTRLRVTPGALDFGFIARGEVATKVLHVRSQDDLGRVSTMTRGDWLSIESMRVEADQLRFVVSADPRLLHGFWEGSGPTVARLDGWLELFDGSGESLRVPAGAILRRDAPAVSWWNPFARRVG